MKDPDKQWRDAKRKGKLKLHITMSSETKEAIKDIKQEIDKKFDELLAQHITPLREEIKKLEEKRERDLEIIETKVAGKVSFKVFTWVLAILMAIVIGVQGVVWFQVKQTYEKTNEVGKDVSLIQYRLDRFESVK